MARWLVVGPVAVALAAFQLTACGAKSTPKASAPPATGISSTTFNAPRSAVAQSGPTTPPNPGVFQAHAASFVTDVQGWVLGQRGCAECGVLLHTVDAGRTWSVMPAPTLPSWPSGALNEGRVDLVFADPSDGYIFGGGPGIAVTHDGGHTWHTTRLPLVSQLVAAGGMVYALAIDTTDNEPKLWRSTAETDSWTALSLPVFTGSTGRVGTVEPFGTLSIAAEAETVAFLRRGDARAVGSDRSDLGQLWISTDRATRWSPRRIPCTADAGATLISIARAHSEAWLLDCFAHTGVNQDQVVVNHLYGSPDGGQHWTRLTDPTHQGLPVLLADNGTGQAFLATEGTSDALDGTLDYAATWHTLLRSGASSDYGWSDLHFTDPATGYILGPTHYAPEHLYRSRDAGATWKQVPMP